MTVILSMAVTTLAMLGAYSLGFWAGHIGPTGGVRALFPPRTERAGDRRAQAIYDNIEHYGTAIGQREVE